MAKIAKIYLSKAILYLFVTFFSDMKWFFKIRILCSVIISECYLFLKTMMFKGLFYR